MEEYIGVKFKLIPVVHQFSPSLLISVDKFVSGFLKVSGNEGNLSVRFDNGFLIKRTDSAMTHMTENDVVFVEKIESEKVYASGGIPSSESRLHSKIYENRPDARIVLHFHADKMLGEGFALEVGPFEYGTLELADAVGKACKEGNIIKIREHGFIIFAKDKEQLKKRFLESFASSQI